MGNRTFYNNILRLFFLFSLFCCMAGGVAFSQNVTTIQGTVRDSVTRELLPFVTVQFDGTTLGAFTDNEGQFKLVNRTGHNNVTISFMGYNKVHFTIPAGKTTVKDILLQPDGLQLGEVVVRPKKEKYSKKNNPAVDLINKVLEHKDANSIESKNYYQYNEYDRILVALNDFKPDQAQFKRFKFLPNYMDTSLIDDKPILPFSVRETVSEVYYRKDPKSTKRIVTGYKAGGIDQAIDAEGVDAIIKEVFKDVSIYDNSITLLLHDFVSPLSTINAVNFYKWYLSDTVNIDNDKFVKLDFAPFNARDVGFTGSLYISLDGDYAVRRALLRAPKKININFVDELIIRQDFEKIGTNQWIPQEQRMAIDLSLIGAVKFYIDKSRTFSKVEVNKQMDPIHVLGPPVVYLRDYEERSADYWSENRLATSQKDLRMDALVKDMQNVLLFKILFGAGKVLWSGYVPTSKDDNKNKLDIGTTMTFFSYNEVEGGRFRGTLATTKNFHPHLYLYGYGAYGLKDHKFKYYGEATWAFNEVKNHKDEFPRNNLSIAYKYDMNSLGQRFTQAERDNILMSLKRSSQRLTYNRQAEFAYQKEYYNGFSFKLSGMTSDEQPAGDLLFEKIDDDGNRYSINKLRTTEAKLALRYAYKEKFFQQRRKRFPIPSERFIVNLSNTTALKDFLGGHYDYNKTSLTITKDFWIAPYGKIMINTEAEKIWGKTPFPFLITPSVNNSFTIQSGNYYLLEPLEFVHDAQVSWEVYYHMGGWFLNRVPFLKALKWREVFGFRGFIGSLSKKNNPYYNRDMILFPERTFTTGNAPYLEYNIGIENIFKFLRIDYVRRVNYLDHPDVDKDGFRISFDVTF